MEASVSRGTLVATEQAEPRDESPAANYRLPDLELIDASPIARWQPFTLDHRVYRVGKDAMFIDGAVVGAADGRARLLVQPTGLFELISAQGRARLVSGKSSNDQQYWPMANPHSVTAWIPLQPVPIEKGPLCFGRGSQRKRIGHDLLPWGCDPNAGVNDDQARAVPSSGAPSDRNRTGSW